MINKQQIENNTTESSIKIREIINKLLNKKIPTRILITEQSVIQSVYVDTWILVQEKLRFYMKNNHKVDYATFIEKRETPSGKKYDFINYFGIIDYLIKNKELESDLLTVSKYKSWTDSRNMLSHEKNKEKDSKISSNHILDILKMFNFLLVPKFGNDDISIKKLINIFSEVLAKIPGIITEIKITNSDMQCPNCGSSVIKTLVSKHIASDKKNYIEEKICLDCGHEWKHTTYNPEYLKWKDSIAIQNDKIIALSKNIKSAEQQLYACQVKISSCPIDEKSFVKNSCYRYGATIKYEYKYKTEQLTWFINNKKEIRKYLETLIDYWKKVSISIKSYSCIYNFWTEFAKRYSFLMLPLKFSPRIFIYNAKDLYKDEIKIITEQLDIKNDIPKLDEIYEKFSSEENLFYDNQNSANNKERLSKLIEWRKNELSKINVSVCTQSSGMFNIFFSKYNDEVDKTIISIYYLPIRKIKDQYGRSSDEKLDKQLIEKYTLKDKYFISENNFVKGNYVFQLKQETKDGKVIIETDFMPFKVGSEMSNLTYNVSSQISGLTYSYVAPSVRGVDNSGLIVADNSDSFTEEKYGDKFNIEIISPEDASYATVEIVNNHLENTNQIISKSYNWINEDEYDTKTEPCVEHDH